MNLSRRTFAAALASIVALPARAFAAQKHPSLLKLEAALIADGCETANATVGTYKHFDGTYHPDTLSVETMRRKPDGQEWHSLCRRTGVGTDVDDRRIRMIVDMERRIWDRHLFHASVERLMVRLHASGWPQPDHEVRYDQVPCVDGETWVDAPVHPDVPARVLRVRVWRDDGTMLWTATDATKPLTADTIGHICEGFDYWREAKGVGRTCGWWTRTS